MNHPRRRLVSKAGGIPVIISFILSVLVYLFVKTFFLKTTDNFIEILIVLVVLLLCFFIGFFDDLFVWDISYKNRQKNLLGGWKKILLTLPIALPLVVISAGETILQIPFIGGYNFGWIYPVIFIPIMVIGVVNGTNLLAGFDGLEAGLGVIIIGTLSVIAYMSGLLWLALIGLIFVVALICFYFFNSVPAKIFPGNTLTYTIGAMIVCFAVLGNMESLALILFIPYIIEGFLKSRSNFKAHSFGIPNNDGSLEEPYEGKVYGLTHLSLKILNKIKKKVYKKDVTELLLGLEFILAAIVLIMVLG
ncbi:MAG: hypothetical protein ABIH51_01010 [Patescibacteria group bacterium]